MTYKVETKYDSRMPSSPGNGTPFTLFACHDTEGGTGRAGALGTIQFLIDRRDRNASYHEIWWYHENTDEFGVIRIVPPYRAAHSVNPTPPTYSPTQWVKESLGRNAADPNQGVYAVSIAGKVADVNRYAKNPKFLQHAHRRFKELQKELGNGINRRAEHFQFNPATRSDWGTLLMPALGGRVIPDELPEMTMDWHDRIELIQPMLVRCRAETSFRERPDLTPESHPVVLNRESDRIVFGRVQGFDFGKGPVWYTFVSSSGGIKTFHEQDIIKKVALTDGTALQAKITEQAAIIANLKTQNVQNNESARLVEQLKAVLNNPLLK